MQKKIDILIHEDQSVLGLYVDNKIVYISIIDETAEILDVLKALNLEYTQHIKEFDYLPELLWEELR